MSDVIEMVGAPTRGHKSCKFSQQIYCIVRGIHILLNHDCFKMSFESPIKKNDYRSVINITLIFDMTFHMVMISTYNNGNDACWKHIKWWWLFGDIVDTLKKGTEQHRKRECLRSVTWKGTAYLLDSKWTQEKIDKASDETINKKYAECKQRELNEKGEKT